MNNLDWFVVPKPTHPAGDLEHGLLSAQILLSVVSVASCSKRIAVFRLTDHRADIGMCLARQPRIRQERGIYPAGTAARQSLDVPKHLRPLGVERGTGKSWAGS